MARLLADHIAFKFCDSTLELECLGFKTFYCTKINTVGNNCTRIKHRTLFFGIDFLQGYLKSLS